MAYKHGDPLQAVFFPKTIDEYVKDDSLVRVYSEFINCIDMKEMGIEENPNKVGNSSYQPRAMLKLFVYGYSYGLQSSRELELACYDCMPFIWIMENLKPDHKTIAEFRRKHKESIEKTTKMCAQMCMV